MAEEPDDNVPPWAKPAKERPAKVLPTDRLSFDKQLGVLRGYVAASGPEKKSVSNSDVAKIVGIHAGTISNCNPFFADVGLLVRDGLQYRPAEDAFSYASAYQWEAENAAHKLAPTLKATWFTDTLVPKLNFRPFSREEAVGFLAEAAKATPDYRAQLETVLEYLRIAGLVVIEGNMVAAAAGARVPTPDTQKKQDESGKARPTDTPVDPNVEEFSIPIPGKASARITFPKGLEAEDWDMLKTMLDAYIRRLRKDSMQDEEGPSREERPSRW